MIRRTSKKRWYERRKVTSRGKQMEEASMLKLLITSTASFLYPGSSTEFITCYIRRKKNRWIGLPGVSLELKLRADLLLSSGHALLMRASALGEAITHCSWTLISARTNFNKDLERNLSWDRGWMEKCAGKDSGDCELGFRFNDRRLFDWMREPHWQCAYFLHQRTFRNSLGHDWAAIRLDTWLRLTWRFKMRACATCILSCNS